MGLCHTRLRLLQRQRILPGVIVSLGWTLLGEKYASTDEKHDLRACISEIGHVERSVESHTRSTRIVSLRISIESAK
jgi:hypothetical protein